MANLKKVWKRKNFSEKDLAEFQFQLVENPESFKGKYLIVDVETTGLPKRKTALSSEYELFPYIVQFAWMLFSEDGKLIESKNYYLKQEKKIPSKAIEIHGITNEFVAQHGIDPIIVFEDFATTWKKAEYFVAHNIYFDLPVIDSQYYRYNLPILPDKETICTMMEGERLCKIPTDNKNQLYKSPSLQELFKDCFFLDVDYLNMNIGHKANIDVLITANCFFKMKSLGHFNNKMKSSTGCLGLLGMIVIVYSGIASAIFLFFYSILPLFNVY